MPGSPAPRDESPGGLRVSVDLNLCQAYAQCCYAAPDRFRLHGHEALFYDPAPPAGAWAEVERARVACPVQAIRLECLGRGNGEGKDEGHSKAGHDERA